jgi:uncharacterized membrane protein YdbT with pleckstrin-like domain
MFLVYARFLIIKLHTFVEKNRIQCINSQSNAMFEILKCLSVVTKIETSGGSKKNKLINKNRITNKNEMIGMLT